MHRDHMLPVDKHERIMEVRLEAIFLLCHNQCGRKQLLFFGSISTAPLTRHPLHVSATYLSKMEGQVYVIYWWGHDRRRYCKTVRRLGGISH